MRSGSPAALSWSLSSTLTARVRTTTSAYSTARPVRAADHSWCSPSSLGVRIAVPAGQDRLEVRLPMPKAVDRAPPVRSAQPVAATRPGVDLKAQLDQPFGTSGGEGRHHPPGSAGEDLQASLRRVHRRCRRASATAGPRSRAARSVSWVSMLAESSAGACARRLEALRRYFAELGRRDAPAVETAEPKSASGRRRRPSLSWLLLTGLLVVVALVGGVVVGAVAWSEDRPASGGTGTGASSAT
jgi:hypothetical protein